MKLEGDLGAEHLGPRLKAVVKLATPAAATMLSYTMVGVVDTLMVGRLGPTALAAVGLTNTVLFTAASFLMGLLGAVNPLTAQNEGAGRHEEAGRFLHQATWIALLGGALFGVVLALITVPLLELLGPGREVITLGSSYLIIRALGLPFFFLTVARDQFLEGLGDTRTPMRVSIVVNVVNAVLNAWLIYGGLGIPALGVVGSALATNLAHALSLVYYQWALRVRHQAQPVYRLSPLRGPSWPLIRQMLKVGWPMGVQYGLDIGSWMVLTAVIGRMGEAALAANQITIRIMSVTFMTVNGVSIAASSLVGRCLGAGKPALARQYGWTSVAVGIGVMASIGSTYLAWPEAWARLFTADAAVMALTVQLLAAGLLFQLMDTVAMVTYGALKGAGDTRFSMIVAVGTAWGVGLPLGYVLAVPMGFGPVGVYYGIVGQMAVASVFYVGRFLGDGWQKAKLVDGAASATADAGADLVEAHAERVGAEAALSGRGVSEEAHPGMVYAETTFTDVTAEAAFTNAMEVVLVEATAEAELADMVATGDEVIAELCDGPILQDDVQADPDVPQAVQA